MLGLRAGFSEYFLDWEASLFFGERQSKMRDLVFIFEFAKSTTIALASLF